MSVKSINTLNFLLINNIFVGKIDINFFVLNFDHSKVCNN